MAVHGYDPARGPQREPSRKIRRGLQILDVVLGQHWVDRAVNAALKGSFVDLARGFFRVFGRVKMSVLLGFTLAAFNLERIRSFRAKHALGGDGSVLHGPSNRFPRRMHRRGTWAQIIKRRPQPPPVPPPP